MQWIDAPSILRNPSSNIPLVALQNRGRRGRRHRERVHMSTSILQTILHYLRICFNYIASLFHHGGGGGGFELSSFFDRGASKRLLTFDNGIQVEIGRQIAEGGFSYVFEAFPINGHRGLHAQRSSSTLTSAASTDDTTNINTANHHHVKYALKR